MTGAVRPAAALEVTTTYPPMAFVLAIAQPRLQLDGSAPIRRPWGTTVLPVSPGRHQLRCWFRWGLFPVAGKASLDVDVPDGALVRLRYQAPTWFVLSRGQWSDGGTTSLPAAGAGWHPDPARRHELRYWDGSGWTSHVSDAGVLSSDELA